MKKKQPKNQTNKQKNPNQKANFKVPFFCQSKSHLPEWPVGLHLAGPEIAVLVACFPALLRAAAHVTAVYHTACASGQPWLPKYLLPAASRTPPVQINSELMCCFCFNYNMYFRPRYPVASVLM